MLVCPNGGLLSVGFGNEGREFAGKQRGYLCRVMLPLQHKGLPSRKEVMLLLVKRYEAQDIRSKREASRHFLLTGKESPNLQGYCRERRSVGVGPLTLWEDICGTNQN